VATERFAGTLERHGSGAVVEVPFDPKAAFGRTRAPVRATVNGHTFRTTLAWMGGRPLLGLNREVREAAGVSLGETFPVELELDDEPRVVEVPADLAEAMRREAGTEARFDALSYTHRKEYVRWVTEARREETRQRRVARAVEMLRANRKTPDRPS